MIGVSSSAVAACITSTCALGETITNASAPKVANKYGKRQIYGTGQDAAAGNSSGGMRQSRQHQRADLGAFNSADATGPRHQRTQPQGTTNVGHLRSSYDIDLKPKEERPGSQGWSPWQAGAFQTGPGFVMPAAGHFAAGYLRHPLPGPQNHGCMESGSGGDARGATPANGKAMHDCNNRDQECIFFKTRKCQFFAHGVCNRGDSCNFAHSDAELRPLPDLSCTKMCPAFVRAGNCQDPSCKYAHAREHIRKLAGKAMHNDRTTRKMASESQYGCIVSREGKGFRGSNQQLMSSTAAVVSQDDRSRLALPWRQPVNLRRQLSDGCEPMSSLMPDRRLGVDLGPELRLTVKRTFINVVRARSLVGCMRRVQTSPGRICSPTCALDGTVDDEGDYDSFPNHISENRQT